MQCIILAAGYGTRLYPITKDLPKPLVPVNDKPILTHIIEKIFDIPNNPLTKIHIVANNNGYSKILSWKQAIENKYVNQTTSLNIINDKTTSNEDRLGAVGDINFTINSQNIDDDILIIGGDNLFEFSLKKLIQFYYHKNSTVVAFREINDQNQLSKLGIGITESDSTKLIGFEEKPAVPKSNLASTLCYVIKRSDLQMIKEILKQGSFDNAGELIKHLTKNSSVHAFKFDEQWFDVGNLDSLAKANAYYQNKKPSPNAALAETKEQLQ